MLTVSRRRVFAIAALLAIAFGVLGMHAAVDLGAAGRAEHSAHECHHEDCAPTPMSRHIGALCVAAAAVAIAAVVLAARRRGGTLPVVAGPSRSFARSAAPRQLPVRPFTELCVLRC